MTNGMFITFEGGEGTGKSTQIARLADILAEKNHEVVTTREPGGTPSAEAARSLLVSGSTSRWSPMAEALLNYAARDSHLNEIIRPALNRSALVLCDRFVDSTHVYQGIAGGCSLDFIEQLRHAVVSETMPAMTFIMDLDPAVGLARANDRAPDAEDRFERMNSTFHEKVRQGFRKIAEQAPERCHLVDASASAEEISAKIAGIVAQRLSG